LESACDLSRDIRQKYILKSFRICSLFTKLYDKLTEEGERIDTCRIKFVMEAR